MSTYFFVDLREAFVELRVKKAALQPKEALIFSYIYTG